MKSFLGICQIQGAGPAEASILIFDKDIHIGYRNTQGETITRRWDLRGVEAGFSLADQESRVRNRQDAGMELIIPGPDATAYIRERQAELEKPWHQQEKAREWGRNLLIFFGIVAFLVALYFLAVPWLSQKLASRVSVKTEEQFGEAVYGALALEEQTDTAASFAVNHFFEAMKIRTPYNIRITVVKGDIVNAFALPGGRIVVYSALLREMDSYPELAALLSHEFTHVNNKHSTKSIFRRLGSKIFIGLLFGRFGNVSAVLADQADNLKNLNYSRSLEKEADLEGLALLQAIKVDPRGFTDLFMHLEQSASSSVVPEFLASHPDIQKRITYIREAAANATVEENPELRDIFDIIKQKINP